VVSTYSVLVSSVSNDKYSSGVLAPNGDIFFIPESAVIGQKISPLGVVSTYSLVYTVASAYSGGVLAPNGDIHFVPRNAVVGQKVSAAGVVSTYALAYTTSSAFNGGVLAPDGSIYFIPVTARVGQKISTCPAIPFGLDTCLSSYLNKF
jgi:streptogramin lyase